MNFFSDFVGWFQKTLITRSINIIQEDRKPNLHVLAIAPKYDRDNAYDSLKYNDNDVQDFMRIMEQQKNNDLFNEVFLDIYTGKDSTETTQLNGAFEQFSKRFETEGVNQVLAKDVVVIFYSGHGTIVDKQFCLVPSDYNAKTEKSTTVNYKDNVIHPLEQLKCHKFVFIDACHSGASGAKALYNPAINESLHLLHTSAKGLITIASCDKDEQSYENDNLQNGYFTYALIEAFEQKDSNRNTGLDLLSIQQIYNTVQKRMNTMQISKPQHPKLLKSQDILNTDIPLFKTIKN